MLENNGFTIKMFQIYFYSISAQTKDEANAANNATNDLFFLRSIILLLFVSIVDTRSHLMAAGAFLSRISSLVVHCRILFGIF